MSSTLFSPFQIGVKAGSLLGISVTSKTTANKTANDVLADVSAELSGNGGLDLRSASVTTGLGSAIVDMLAGLTTRVPFQASLTVQTKTDFASSNDVLSIVKHAFYDSVGELPITASVTSIQQPGESTPTATGQPGAAPGGPGGDAGVAGNISDAISKFFSGLKTTTISLVIGLAAIVILVLILIAYGPNVGRIASAAA